MLCLQSCRLRSLLMQQCLVLLFYWLRWILDFLAIGQIRSHQRPGISQSPIESLSQVLIQLGGFFFVQWHKNLISLYLYWHISVLITLILERWCQKKLFKKPGSCPWLPPGPGAGVGSAVLPQMWSVGFFGRIRVCPFASWPSDWPSRQWCWIMWGAELKPHRTHFIQGCETSDQTWAAGTDTRRSNIPVAMRGVHFHRLSFKLALGNVFLMFQI